MKKILLGGFLVLIIEIIIVGTLYILYNIGFFNSNPSKNLGIININKTDKISNKEYKIQIKDNNNTKIVGTLESNKKTKNTKNKIKIKIINEIEINKNYYLFDILINKANDKNFLLKTYYLFVSNYNNKKLFPIKSKDFLNYYLTKLQYNEKSEYFNNVEKLNRYKKEIYKKYIKNIQNILTINKENELIKLNNEYIKIKKKINNFLRQEIDNDFCYNNFCSSNKEIIKGYKIKDVYNYIKEAIYKDKIIQKYLDKDVEVLFKKDKKNIIKLALSILIIENLRQHTTYKGYFKKFFVKVGSKLSVMTKFSYGLFGIKLKTLDNIINSRYVDSIPKIKYIKDTFYTLNKNYKKYNGYYNIYGTNCYYSVETNKWECKYIRKSKEKVKEDNNNIDIDKNIINYIVNDKEVQILLFLLFEKQQIENRKNNGIDISKEYGVLGTLWNIGGFKKPHKDYDVGGALLDFLNNKIWFGDLINIIINSTELEKIYIDIFLKNENLKKTE